MGETNSKPDLTNGPAASGDATTARERRRHQRTPVKGNATATIRKDGGEPMEVRLRDMSRSGMGVYAPAPVTAGERVELVFALTRRPPLRATCRVASCSQEPDGRYRVGLEFLEIARAGGPAAGGVEPKSGPVQ